MCPDLGPTLAKGRTVATWFRHQLIFAGHALGIPVERLAKL
jgi:hypothetical protein